MNFSFLKSTKKDLHFLSLSSLLIGIFLLSLQDAIVKAISSNVTFWQIQLIRSFFNLFFLISLVTIIKNYNILWPKNFVPVFLRALMMVLCMAFFFAASPILSISQMAAGLYTFPIFVTILSILVSKETIGLYRIIALFIGFLGSLFILEPWKNNFEFYQLFPIFAGFFYACNIILIRKFCRNESPVSLTFIVGICFCLSGLLGVSVLEIYPMNIDIGLKFITSGWVELTFYSFFFIILCSILNITGNLALAKAYQNAESSWLAPLDYFYLIFACLWSKIIFDIWPKTTDLVGILFITCSGLIIIYREKIKSDYIKIKNNG